MVSTVPTSGSLTPYFLALSKLCKARSFSAQASRREVSKNSIYKKAFKNAR